jgi:hypothetical protein
MLVERSGKAPKGNLALLALLAFTPCLSLHLATWCKSEQPGPLSSSSSMAAALLLLIRPPALAACSNPIQTVPFDFTWTLLQPSAQSCLNVLHSVTLLNLAVFTLTLIYLISSR